MPRLIMKDTAVTLNELKATLDHWIAIGHGECQVHCQPFSPQPAVPVKAVGLNYAEGGDTILLYVEQEKLGCQQVSRQPTPAIVKTLGLHYVRTMSAEEKDKFFGSGSCNPNETNSAEFCTYQQWIDTPNETQR